ncbi:sensor histidine kinase, partial [Streptococcus hyovaginalis]
ELLAAIGLLISLHFSYNDFLLLVFADVFYHSRDLYTLLDKRYWRVVLFRSFVLLLRTDVHVFSSVLPLQAVGSYLCFLHFFWAVFGVFFKN